MEGLHKHGHEGHDHDNHESQDQDHDHDLEHLHDHDLEHLHDQDIELCVQHTPKKKMTRAVKAFKWVKSHLKHNHSHEENENINLRAAMIHCIGDIVQSVGVIIAAYIIRFKPEWKIVDPICTFIFSVLVLFTTLNIMKDAIHVLMEGTPKNINYNAVKKDLTSIEGVEQAHTLNIWSISSTRIALAGHLVIRPESNSQEILKKAVQLAKAKYNVDQSTLQVEIYEEAMNDCSGCQSENRPTTKNKGIFYRLISCVKSDL